MHLPWIGERPKQSDRIAGFRPAGRSAPAKPEDLSTSLRARILSLKPTPRETVVDSDDYRNEFVFIGRFNCRAPCQRIFERSPRAHRPERRRVYFEEARTQLTEALKAATDICNHFDAEYQSDGGGGLEQIEGVPMKRLNEIQSVGDVTGELHAYLLVLELAQAIVSLFYYGNEGADVPRRTKTKLGIAFRSLKRVAMFYEVAPQMLDFWNPLPGTPFLDDLQRRKDNGIENSEAAFEHSRSREVFVLFDLETS